MTLKHAPQLLASTGISPFLPGTNIQFSYDSTSLGWLKTCARLYEYQMLEGWRAKGTGVHLKFGQLYHSALELYDKARLGQIQAYEGNEPIEGEPGPLDHENALRLVVHTTLKDTWEYPDKSDLNLGVRQYEDGLSEADTDELEALALRSAIELLGPGKSWASDHPAKNRETLIRSVIWYLDNFKDDPAATLILANGKPAVELSFRMELDWGPKILTYLEGPEGHETPAGQPYILSGHLDRVF